jgi:hypothetical protein
VHLAGSDVEVHALERSHPAELLGDAPHFEQGSALVGIDHVGNITGAAAAANRTKS